MELSLFEEKKVKYEYVPHRMIILKFRPNFILKVCKPYALEAYPGYYYVDPCFHLEANAQLNFDYAFLELVEASIKEAIDILNSENDGIIIKKNFNFSGTCIKVEEVSEHFHRTNGSCIPQKSLKIGTVYEEKNGEQFVYLGKGKCYQDGKRMSSQRETSRYLYLPWKRQFNQCYHITDCNRTFVFHENCEIVREKYKKQFIKSVCDLQCSFDKIIDLTHEYKIYCFS